MSAGSTDSKFILLIVKQLVPKSKHLCREHCNSVYFCNCRKCHLMKELVFQYKFIYLINQLTFLKVDPSLPEKKPLRLEYEPLLLHEVLCDSRVNLFDSKVSLGNSNISLNSFGDLFEILQTAFRILYYIGAVNPTSESGIFPAQGLSIVVSGIHNKGRSFFNSILQGTLPRF